MQSSGDKEIINKIVSKFHSLYPLAGKPELYFSPGRIEIGGNHTDHNNGRILAAAINTGTIAAASINGDNKINLFSLNFNSKWTVDLDNLTVIDSEKGQTSALIRGIAAGFKRSGYKTGGFNCVLESSIGIGSGLSSSASVEVLTAYILNDLFNEGEIPPVELAKAGRYAENEYFGKPCGLMDQLAIAEGGIVLVDFFNPSAPKVKKFDFDFNKAGYSIIVVNTGSSHDDLTGQYASIPAEMKSVAAYFNKESCRSLSRSEILEHLDDLRKGPGDRAVLRALHFLSENERVAKMAAVLKKSNIRKFLKLVNESGLSSALWLQNMYAVNNPREQNLNIALDLTKYFFKQHKTKGASRVHGGGFGGTIITFIEQSHTGGYIKQMEKVFGKGACINIKVNLTGAGKIK